MHGVVRHARHGVSLLARAWRARPAGASTRLLAFLRSRSRRPSRARRGAPPPSCRCRCGGRMPPPASRPPSAERSASPASFQVFSNCVAAACAGGRYGASSSCVPSSFSSLVWPSGAGSAAACGLLRACGRRRRFRLHVGLDPSAQRAARALRGFLASREQAAERDSTPDWASLTSALHELAELLAQRHRLVEAQPPAAEQARDDALGLAAGAAGRVLGLRATAPAERLGAAAIRMSRASTWRGMRLAPCRRPRAGPGRGPGW